jgi:hypothetical protein
MMRLLLSSILLLIVIWPWAAINAEPFSLVYCLRGDESVVITSNTLGCDNWNGNAWGGKPAIQISKKEFDRRLEKQRLSSSRADPLKNLSTETICIAAADGGQWKTNPDTRKYVFEAKRRRLTPSVCNYQIQEKKFLADITIPDQKTASEQRTMGLNFQKIFAAAGQGDAKAQYKLGDFYFYGLGVMRDREIGISWWRKAAKQGEVQSQLRLSKLFSDGKFVPKDSAEAERWAQKVAEQRAKDAKALAIRLAKEAMRASASKKVAAEAAARQAKIDAQRLKKLAAEAKTAVAEARRKTADALNAEARARAKLEAARRVADRAESQRIAKLEAETQIKMTQAKEALRKRVASLSVGLRPENTFMDVAVKSAKVRKLPERSAQEVSQLERNDQVHVVSVLPTGWVQIAEEGEPIGWLHRAALRPSSRTAAGIASRPSTASPSILYATNFPFPKGKANPNAVAVIVGNRTYQHRDVPDVSYAYNDVEAIRQYVIKARGFKERNVFVLKDATKAKLESYFGSVNFSRGRLFNAVREGKSDVFVYFSGHGVPGENKTGYLFPTDGDPTQAELTGYSIQTLVENLAKVPARSMIIALDTCFSGVSQAGALVQAASPVYLKAKIPSAGPNSIILTAAAGSQIASWDTGAQLGLFTRHLLEGMLGKADTRGGDSDGRVQLGELQSYVQSEVTYQARRRYSRDQTPEMLGNPEFVLSSFTSVFPGFGDPNAMGETPASWQRQASPQPSTVTPEQGKKSGGFSFFGIKVAPSGDEAPQDQAN